MWLFSLVLFHWLSHEKQKLFVFISTMMHDEAWWRGSMRSAWQMLQSHSTAVENDLGCSEISVKQVCWSTTTPRNDWVSTVTFSCTLQYHQMNYVIFQLYSEKLTLLILIRPSKALFIFSCEKTFPNQLSVSGDEVELMTDSWLLGQYLVFSHGSRDHDVGLLADGWLDCHEIVCRRSRALENKSQWLWWFFL